MFLKVTIKVINSLAAFAVYYRSDQLFFGWQLYHKFLPSSDFSLNITKATIYNDEFFNLLAFHNIAHGIHYFFGDIEWFTVESL